MRCPKCGYISFDHLTSCKQCQKDFPDDAIAVNGGTFNAISPSFLQVADPSDASPSDGEEFDEEIVDSELDVLLSDENDDDIFTLDDDDDEEIDFDFVLPEVANTALPEEVTPDSPQPEGRSAADDEFDLLLESEAFLADEENTTDQESAPIDGLTELDDLLEIDHTGNGKAEDDLFDLEEELLFDDTPTDPTPAPPVSTNGHANFDLDDLDLDALFAEDIATEETIETPSTADIKRANSSLNPDGSVNMDADLNFDLDLGGLSLHKKE